QQKSFASSSILTEILISHISSLKNQYTVWVCAFQVLEGQQKQFPRCLNLCWRQHEAVCIPMSYLNQPLFQELLSQVEEYGYDHPMGGLTILCSEDEFLNIDSRLNEIRHFILCLVETFHLAFNLMELY
ncbi:hypothetical protein S83_004503, partial [Arachis hypogaea]